MVRKNMNGMHPIIDSGQVKRRGQVDLDVAGRRPGVFTKWKLRYELDPCDRIVTKVLIATSRDKRPCP